MDDGAVGGAPIVDKFFDVVFGVWIVAVAPRRGLEAFLNADEYESAGAFQKRPMARWR